MDGILKEFHRLSIQRLVYDVPVLPERHSRDPDGVHLHDRTGVGIVGLGIEFDIF